MKCSRHSLHARSDALLRQTALGALAAALGEVAVGAALRVLALVFARARPKGRRVITATGRV